MALKISCSFSVLSSVDKDIWRDKFTFPNNTLKPSFVFEKTVLESKSYFEIKMKRYNPVHSVLAIYCVSVQICFASRKK